MTSGVTFTVSGGYYPGWVKRPEQMTPEELLARVKQLEEDWQRAQDQAEGYGGVIEATAKTVAVHVGNQVLSAVRPRHLDIEVGTLVRINKLGQVVAVCDPPPAFGVVMVVQRIDGRHAIVSGKAAPDERAVFFRGEPPKPGDQVLVDLSMTAIVKNMGKPPSKLAFAEDTGVAWDDIGGQEEAKRDLREAIEGPVVHADVYKRFGKAQTRGVLLWGRPGNGKTMLGKAAATALAKLHGASARAGGFVYVKGPELLNMFVGASEGNVRQLFAAAREHHARHGYPALIFVDEADAILGKRGQGRVEGMERTIVPQFLAEMDGLDACDAVVLLATNRPDVLDPAVVRDGRVDRKIEVRSPSQSDAAAIIAARLHGKPLHGDASELGALAAQCLFEDLAPLFIVRGADPKDDRRVVLSDFVSGAICAAVAERAIQYAVRRAIAKEKPEGVARKDLGRAVTEARESLRGTDHTGDLQAIVEALPAGTQIRGVEKVAAPKREST